MEYKNQKLFHKYYKKATQEANRSITSVLECDAVLAISGDVNTSTANCLISASNQKPLSSIPTCLNQVTVYDQVMIRNILTDVVEEIKNINVNKSNIEADKESIFKNIELPINNEKVLNDLEELLKVDNNFKQCVYELCKIGGSNLYEFTIRCLIMLFSNQFAANYSWHGAKKKNKFGVLRVAEAIIVAAERNKWNSRKETGDSIKKWLRRAKERSVANAKINFFA